MSQIGLYEGTKSHTINQRLIFIHRNKGIEELERFIKGF